MCAHCDVSFSIGERAAEILGKEVRGRLPVLKPSDHLHLNHQEEIAAQVFDDEAVIMRLADGAYFNMNKVGGAVWEMIQTDSSLEEIIAAVVQRFDVSADQAEMDVLQLVEQLLDERLVVSSNHNEPGADVKHDEPRDRLPYETPVLHGHQDMGDLLALDPPFGTDCKCGNQKDLRADDDH